MTRTAIRYAMMENVERLGWWSCSRSDQCLGPENPDGLRVLAKTAPKDLVRRGAGWSASETRR